MADQTNFPLRNLNLRLNPTFQGKGTAILTTSADSLPERLIHQRRKSPLVYIAVSCSKTSKASICIESFRACTLKLAWAHFMQMRAAAESETTGSNTCNAPFPLFPEVSKIIALTTLTGYIPYP
jgi:hypothetical protein